MKWLSMGALLLLTSCGAIIADISADINKAFGEINAVVIADAEQAITMAQRATDQGPPAPATRLACYQAVLKHAQARPNDPALLPKGILSAAELYFETANAVGAGITGIIPVAIHDACAPLVLTVLQQGARRGLETFGIPSLGR